MNSRFKLSAIAVAALTLTGAGQAQIDRTPVSWNTGDFEVTVTPAVVTSDGAGTHTTTPGTAAFGVNHDGVGLMLINNNSNPAFEGVCTASLLTMGGRQWAITAAHCVTNGSGNINANNVQLQFQTPSGVKIANSQNIFKHPNYNGNVANGFDVALIELTGAVDPAVPSYALNRTAGDLNVTGVHVGYGLPGFGGTGQAGAAGTKRAGLVEHEAFGLGFLGIGGITNNQTQLTHDFDSGNAANDAFNFFFPGTFGPDLGFGDDEVGVSQGDSGGPTFINDGGTYKISGIHSYGTRLALSSGGNSDVDAALNFSWGEFSVDARVMDPQVLAWIDQTIIPEPSSLLLLTGALPLLLRRRRAA